MNNADLMEILGIADQIENAGGWQVAAVKLRALVGEYKMDVEDVAKINVDLMIRNRALEAKEHEAMLYYRCETCLMYFPLHRTDCHHAPQTETKADDHG
jgi:hypothetical protein